jgi:DNA-directed RNA polymerase subunit RPC12/RpoP
MAECIYCGRTTELHTLGVPVCVHCSKELEAGRTPPYHEAPEKEPPSGLSSMAF